ncbi:MHS family proline/betaine transporter-like MFS transporter [Leucobacter exalbidus]|uniref:MHS family proline/betaine transporter-like MFS transporter n=1 Tax=Leucobacter exalbidus TaxID=662960 RepID=A0A940PMP4_9MICO|nr:MFS transporter [Leucobacter exalbidus]MBP1325973.1 MHS family proline/betaine transporter-like MFS transporter [Leucobacter exalbidus]
MTTQLAPAPSNALVRKASIAGGLGTIVESYDFFVYTYLIVYTAPLFFPGEDPFVAILSSLLVLGSGFLARPLGGLVFGRLGDRKGRRFTLMLTVISMGVVTFCMGLLPTYATIGIAAPLALVLLRLFQGFSAGGELAGSTTFVSEHAGKGNHGFLSSITPLGTAFGAALAPGVVALVTLILSEEVMREWGWRVPLLLSLPLTLVCLLLRLGLEDSPEFKRLAAAKTVTRSPVRELLVDYWRPLLKVTLLSASVLMIGYIINAYVPLFLQQQAGFEPGATATMASIQGVSAIVFTIGTALVIDKLGRRTTMITLMGCMALAFLPVLIIMKTTDTNFWISAAGFALLGGLGGAIAAPVYASLTAVFPARVRYTGAALGFGLGAAIGGGAGPALAAQLTQSSGNPYAAAYLAIAAALLGIVFMITIPSRGVADDDGKMVTGDEPAAAQPAADSQQTPVPVGSQAP